MDIQTVNALFYAVALAAGWFALIYYVIKIAVKNAVIAAYKEIRSLGVEPLGPKEEKRG